LHDVSRKRPSNLIKSRTPFRDHAWRAALVMNCSNVARSSGEKRKPSFDRRQSTSSAVCAASLAGSPGPCRRKVARKPRQRILGKPAKRRELAAIDRQQRRHAGSRLKHERIVAADILRLACAIVRLRCKTPLFFSSGPICVLLSSWRSPPGASYGIIGPTLVDRLRRTGDCRRWGRAAEELDEAPQVLSGCGQ
jgi:hypothetical protein